MNKARRDVEEDKEKDGRGKREEERCARKKKQKRIDKGKSVEHMGSRISKKNYSKDIDEHEKYNDSTEQIRQYIIHDKEQITTHKSIYTNEQKTTEIVQ